MSLILRIKMMARFLIIALATGLMFHGTADAKDCSLKQMASLEMTDDGADRVVVPVSVADQSHKFLVDTAGAHSEIYGDVADKLGLTSLPLPPNLEIYDMAGGLAKRYVRVPRYSLGPASGSNWILVVENREADERDVSDGILGPDALRNFDLDFDFAQKKLNLFDPDHCAGKVVYWASAYTDADFTLRDEHIVVPMTLDGKEVQATVDTGASVTSISENLSNKLFGIDRTAAEAADSSNALFRYRYRFKSLSVGSGLAIANPSIYLIPDLARKSFDKRHTDKLDLDPVYGAKLDSPQLLLGMNVLRKLHLYVAYKERKVYFTAAGAH